MKVGDLVKHDKYGLGCVVKLSKADIEINGQSFWYEVLWTDGFGITVQWGPSLEVINGSR